jgi:hypothetical protein
MKRCSPAVDVLIGTWQASRLLLYRYKGGGVKFSTEVLLYLVAVLIILSFIAALVAWVILLPALIYHPLEEIYRHSMSESGVVKRIVAAVFLLSVLLFSLFELLGGARTSERPLAVACNFDFWEPKIEVIVRPPTGEKVTTHDIGRCSAYYFSNPYRGGD